MLVIGHTHSLFRHTDELVELHRRLMTLRERHILQQVRKASEHHPSSFRGLVCPALV